MDKIVIKGSRRVTGNGIKEADLLIKDEKIERIAPSVKTPPGAREIKADGLYTMPGIIDPHVHFELPAYNSSSEDDFYTGSRSAAAGGVTTFLDFAIPSEDQTMLERIKEKSESAAGKSIIDFSFHAQLTNFNDNKLKEMEEVAGYGIKSFKIFMPATEGWGVDDAGIYRALEKSTELESLVLVHAENGELADFFTESLKKSGRVSVKDYPSSRPAFIEKEAVLRATLLASEAGAPIYICHLSSAKGMKELRRLKKEGNIIYVETCPQYLILTDELLKKRNGYLYACCPPVRKDADNYELWRGIFENDIDTIGTDHCPFSKAKKSAQANDFTKIPMGLPGVENSLPVFYSEGVVKRDIEITKLVNLMSTNPARIHGLYPQKGSLKEGTDADIVIFNPRKKVKIKTRKLHSKCDWSPYENFKTKGSPEYTISRGAVVYEKGEFRGKKGRGKFLKRKPSPFYSSQ
ncbi:MAG: dihydropyrimidinase [Elusimicrobia bacterium]|jgi:dihydropyrimidinase|nr:dihydropyrimidinase [Elusimicrobiota bacterium]